MQIAKHRKRLKHQKNKGISCGLRPCADAEAMAQASEAHKAKLTYAKASVGEGGERGIRTPGPFGSTVFKTAALDRSAISPAQK